jgi:hypothetical protein
MGVPVQIPGHVVGQAGQDLSVIAPAETVEVGLDDGRVGGHAGQRTRQD